MSDIQAVTHPFDLFQYWYLASMGKSRDQSAVQKFKIKLNYGLKNIFTRFVPSLDRMNNNAFVLATASSEAVPSSRVVLLKQYSKEGFTFYTNYNSAKSNDLLGNPIASMNFFWSYPTRQVRIVGAVNKVSEEQSSEYWNSRPRGSQEGGLASNQSSSIQSYDELLANLNHVKETYENKKIPCPKHWGGFTIIPKSYEFWEAMPNRLHKRSRYTLSGGSWEKEYLSP